MPAVLEIVVYMLVALWLLLNVACFSVICSSALFHWLQHFQDTNTEFQAHAILVLSVEFDMARRSRRGHFQNFTLIFQHPPAFCCNQATTLQADTLSGSSDVWKKKNKKKNISHVSCISVECKSSVYLAALTVWKSKSAALCDQPSWGCETSHRYKVIFVLQAHLLK